MSVAMIAASEEETRTLARAFKSYRHLVHPCHLSLSREDRSASLEQRLRALNPSVVLLRADARSLTQAREVTNFCGALTDGPALVLLTPDASPEALALAASGALAHLIEPVLAQTLVAAVIIAAARSGERQALEQSLLQMRQSSEVRKVVERAKAVLMRRLNLTENDAHRRLQQESRKRNQKLVETAAKVVEIDKAISRQPRTPSL
jgi:AmiR/NasT family two-component response regulator